MKLTDNEKRDVVKLIEEGKVLPEKYRFLLFEESKQVELNWNGKSDEVTNVALPFQIIEQIDEPRNEEVKMAQDSLDFALGRQMTGWTNKLIWGDNKYILSSLNNGPMREEIEKQGGIKLIYIDPPFDVGADFSMNIEIGNGSYEKKPNVLEQLAYRDTWGKGSDSFLSMLYERLVLIKRLMSDDGSIYVHCDWRVNSSMRLILDEIFGNNNFRAEISWRKLTSVKTQSNFFSNVKDSIFFYTKSNNVVFNKIFISGKNDEKNYPYLEENTNRRYGTFDFTQKGSGDPKKFGKKILTPPPGKHWIWSQEKIDQGIEKGLIVFTKTGNPRVKRYLDQKEGNALGDLWTDDEVMPLSSNSEERKQINYPTQKPEALIKRIIETSSNENDLVADFFCGSGTTLSMAEKLNRKWIGSDLGKFSIHTSRKRMIGVQREQKKLEKNWRAFEILNLGKYQRQHFIYDGKNERDDVKKSETQLKEKAFENLILEAYKATSVNGFTTIHGKKGGDFVSLGPINQPLSRNHVEEVISECLKNNITTLDILGFEYEMGLFPTIQEEAKAKGLRLSYKQIPMEVFDKRAVSKGEIIFYDVAYIEFKPHFKGNKLSVELTDFKVFYNEDNFNIDETLGNGKSKVVVDNGQIVEKKKDKGGIISETVLTKNWHDWIDYWSVDFDYESKKEIIKLKTDDEKIEEVWTGNYVFENEWQSFRGEYKDNRLEKLEFKTSEIELIKDITKVAVKVVDIFGNDTMKVLEVSKNGA